jgi:alpha-glucosidase (family GH31 glycosyl hydrolase)
MYDYGEYVSGNTVAHDGTSGWELHNAYPVQYQSVAFDFFMKKASVASLPTCPAQRIARTCSRPRMSS